MKKQAAPLLSIITAILVSFTLGFLAGRNQNHEIIRLTSLPTVPMHLGQSEPTIPDADTESVFPINLNTADVFELTALPGIGESLARRIVLYREHCGPFARPEDLMNVEGIGQAKLEAVLDYIVTGG